jgi:hypothetical protein
VTQSPGINLEHCAAIVWNILGVRSADRADLAAASGRRSRLEQVMMNMRLTITGSELSMVGRELLKLLHAATWRSWILLYAFPVTDKETCVSARENDRPPPSATVWPEGLTLEMAVHMRVRL